MSLRPRLLLLGLVALAPGACEQKVAVDCPGITFEVAEGAKCVLVNSGLPGAEAVRPEQVDVANCPRFAKTFNALGLTAHDADKIVGSSVDDFFETYKGESFCKYLESKKLLLTRE